MPFDNQEQRSKIENKIQEIIDQPGFVFKGRRKIKESELVHEYRVYRQALTHNVWLKEIGIIKKKFPHETPEIQKYRNENKRQFTREITRKSNQGVVSIINQITIAVQTKNKKVTDWLESKPFEFGNSKYDFNKWSTNKVIPYAFIDCNSIFLPVPEFRGKFEVVGVKPQIIPFNRKWIAPSGDYMIVINSGDESYWVIDKTEWWELKKTKDAYEWTLMYEHNMGELPFEYLPGLETFDDDSGKFYRDNILSPTYEILDEAAVTHTSLQALKLKMQNILVRAGISCHDCSGTGYLKPEPGKVKGKKCAACEGDGFAKRLTDHDDLIVKPEEMTAAAEGKVELFKPYYLAPDVACYVEMKKDHSDLMTSAKKSIGVDALIDAAESGEAMKKRLQVFEEFMAYLIYVTYTTHLTKFLELVQKMLEVKPSEWKEFPSIQVPKRIQIKTPELLKMDFDAAVGADRLQKALDYYNAQYSEDPVTQRAMRMLVEFYPASIETNSDLAFLKAMNVYSARDIQKAKRALPLLKKEIKKDLDGKVEDETIIAAVEALLEKLLPAPVQEPAAEEEIAA